MNEFDFVKLTLWLSCVLTLGLGGGAVYCANRTAHVKDDLATIERRVCTEVGTVAKDVKILEDEKRNDKLPDTTDTQGIYTFFMTQAQRSRIDATADYALHPRDKENHAQDGYVDQSFDVQFKKDRPKTREQIMMFVYHCETQSRRIKLQKAHITLVEDKATDDVWSADSLLFVRRDPLKTGAN